VRGAFIAAVLALAPVLALTPVFALTPGATMAQNDASDAAIDARIRASAEAAESLQGPLDGAWTLVSAAGGAIFAFQIVDKPGGREPLEGVWRDLRRAATPGDIGVIATLARGSDTLTIGFIAKPGQPAVDIELKSGAGGQWTGELREAGAVTAVSLRRG